jgi:CheY-like chemotaxis protein
MRQDGPGIVVVHRELRAQKLFKRILGPLGCPIHFVSTVDEATEKVQALAAKVVLIQVRFAETAEGQQFVSALTRSGSLACIGLICEGSTPNAELFTESGFASLIPSGLPLLVEELSTSCRKILRDDLFGLEKYVVWGAEVVAAEILSTKRADILDRLAHDVIAWGLGARLACQARMVADELISNAIFHAPVDETGAHFRRNSDRSMLRDLSATEQVHVRYACDSRYLIVEVTDRFGSLIVDNILPYVAKCYAEQDGKVSLMESGAGIGLSMVCASCDQFVFNLAPGKSCQAIGLFDLRKYPSQLHVPSTSFHVFVSAGGQR